MMQLGIVGCGNMGGGMVNRLLDSGQHVVCYDPDHTNRLLAVESGAEEATSASDLAMRCNTIILSLPNAAVVQSVMTEIIGSIQPGTVVLDTSTSKPDTSQEMAAMGASHGFDFVDGPVSGGPVAARSGNMTMLLGGDKEAIKRLRPLVDMLTGKTVIVGGSGAGHAAKIANNMLCAANLVLVAEAVRLGEASGIAAKDLLDGVNAGSGRSGVSEVNYPKWILNDAFDSGFTMGLMRKDVGLALDLARNSDVDLRGFSSIARIWLEQSTELPDSADFNEITKCHDNGAIP